jgi:hypothetical protein
MTWGWKEHESTEFVVPEAVEGGEVVEEWLGWRDRQQHHQQYTTCSTWAREEDDRPGEERSRE